MYQMKNLVIATAPLVVVNTIVFQDFNKLKKYTAAVWGWSAVVRCPGAVREFVVTGCISWELTCSYAAVSVNPCLRYLPSASLLEHTDMMGMAGVGTRVGEPSPRRGSGVTRRCPPLSFTRLGPHAACGGPQNMNDPRSVPIKSWHGEGEQRAVGKTPAWAPTSWGGPWQPFLPQLWAKPLLPLLIFTISRPALIATTSGVVQRIHCAVMLFTCKPLW